MKSSTHVYGAAEQDPAWFREEDTRTGPVRTRLERSLLEVEALVRDFADDNPHLDVTVLRFANVLGTDIVTPISHDLAPAAAPLHRRLRPAGPVRRGGRRGPGPRVRHRATGSPACSTWPATGKLPWSEVASIGGAHLLPLPPFGPAAVRRPARPAGRGPVPPRDGGLAPLRAGRGHLAAARGRVRVPLHQRRGRARASPGPTTCAGPRGRPPPEYRYEQDVEQFFRHSPAVVRGIGRLTGTPTVAAAVGPGQPVGRAPGADGPLLGGHGVADVVLPLGR